MVATTDTWTVPGTTPAKTARMIEQISDEQRGELMDNIYSHGNLLAFTDTTDEGNLVKEFTAYVENHQAKGPFITHRTDLKCMVTHWTTFFTI